VEPLLPSLPIPLSYTSLNDYEVCPKRFYHKHLAKDIPPENKSYAQLGGTAVHEALKKRLKIREPLPEEFKQYEGPCVAIESHDSIKHLELKLGVDASGQAVDFFGPRVRLRGALDVAMLSSPVALILDWKTGKPWEAPFELQVQGLLLKAKYPDLKLLTGAYVWLKEGGRVGPLYKLDAQKAWGDVCDRAASIAHRIKTNDWPADDGPLCAYCPVPKTVCHFRRDPR